MTLEMQDADTNERDNRYQHQRWFVRLWRRRWQLLIPFTFIRYAWSAVVRDRWFEDDDGNIADDTTWERVKLCWSMACSKACMSDRMNWFYRWDEVDEEMSKRLEKRR